MTRRLAVICCAALCSVTLSLAACASGDHADGPIIGKPQTVSLENRTAFVQLFEWKWTDIARECEDYLGPKGFAAVQISPPNEHDWIPTGDGAPFPWWMRYQPVSYSLDASRSGTRAQFIDMVNRCNAVGVGIYADAVFNHMTAGSGTTSSSGNDPWGVEMYPKVPYSPSDFHPTCSVTNYQDASNVQNCQLTGLQDLDTSSPSVQAKIVDYLVDMATIGVKGFRIDAAKHMAPADVTAIVDQTNARLTTRPYWFLEVIGAVGEAVQPDQYFGVDDSLANVTEFAYGPQLFTHFVGGGTLAQLKTFGESWGLIASDKAVAFIDNHDTERGHAGAGNYITYHDGASHDLANVFMLAWPYGYPVIMSSYAFNTASAFDTSYGPPFDPATGATRGPWDIGVTQAACFDQTVGGWVCEHRTRAIGNLVGFRNATLANWEVTDWWDNGNNQIAFGRGDKGFVVLNREAGSLTRTFHTSLPTGHYCDVVSGDFTSGAGGPACSGSVVSVDASGNASITVAAMAAAAIHAGAMLDASPPASAVTVTFNEVADTNFGENIYVVGNLAALASWNTATALPMTRGAGGTGTTGSWQTVLSLPAATAVEYKYIKQDGAGTVTWESGDNRTLMTGAAGTSQSTSDTWK